MATTTLAMYNTTSNQSLDTVTGGETDPTKILMKKITSVLLVSILAVIMMSLGCTIQLENLIKQLKRPLPAIIGMLLQFVVYPLMVFGMAHAFQLNEYDALGMLLMGTCPGGSLSNLITYWCSGDVVLSVCMTSVATTAAIGMMPLNLFIYSRAFTTAKLSIPYVKIIIGLAIILVPVSIGMLILRKLPKIAKVIVNIGGVLGFLFILTVIAINFYIYPQMFDADWKLWCTAILLPIFGLGVGYLGSLIACLTHKQCRTVGIEVSSQNVALCITLIYVSFKIEEASKIVMFPLIFGMFNVFVLVVFTIACRVTFVIMKKRGCKEQNSKSMPSPSDNENCASETKF